MENVTALRSVAPPPERQATHAETLASALHEIARDSQEGESVRIAVGALLRTPEGRTLLTSSPVD